MEKIHFRKARTEDGREILRIYDESIHYDDATYLTQCPSWKQWDNEHDSNYRIVADLEGKVVGFVTVSDVTCEKESTVE
ncbi:MAG: GNAT family N-acetyltransferase, partial [Coprococcus sp.]